MGFQQLAFDPFVIGDILGNDQDVFLAVDADRFGRGKDIPDVTVPVPHRSLEIGYFPPPPDLFHKGGMIFGIWKNAQLDAGFSDHLRAAESIHLKPAFINLDDAAVIEINDDVKRRAGVKSNGKQVFTGVTALPQLLFLFGRLLRHGHLIIFICKLSPSEKGVSKSI